LTQETCQVLLHKSHQVLDPKKLKTWLFTTLYREFLKKRRRINRFPEVDLESVDLSPVEGKHMDNLDSALLLSALQKLDEEYRAPVVMFYLDQLSYKEIAAVLNLPIGTVMSRLSRGKSLLREQLSSASPLNVVAKPVAVETGSLQAKHGVTRETNLNEASLSQDSLVPAAI
jgi:RNA polymerase sigma-70 factor (ECF subfamily)